MIFTRFKQIFLCIKIHKITRNYLNKSSNTSHFSSPLSNSPLLPLKTTPSKTYKNFQKILSATYITPQFSPQNSPKHHPTTTKVPPLKEHLNPTKICFPTQKNTTAGETISPILTRN